MKNLVIIWLAVSSLYCSGQTKDPSFEEVISLRSVGTPVISADGKTVAFTVRTADWDQNEFDSEIWISRGGGQAFQATQATKGSSNAPNFSPDNKWLAFLSDRGGKNQIYVMRLEGGEAFAITAEKENISDLEWHSSGKKILFTKTDSEDKKKKDEEKRYGGFATDDKEFALTHLWQVDFKPDLRNPSELPCYQSVDSLRAKSGCLNLAKPERLTEGEFTITSFKGSPDGILVAFNHQPNPLINSFIKSDISLIDINSKKVSALVVNKSADGLAAWSPDSKEVLFTSSENDTTSNFYKNSKLFAIEVNGKKVRRLGTKLDEDFGGQFSWQQDGIYFTLWNKMNRLLYKIDPKSGDHTVFLNSPEQIFSATFSKTGQFAINAKENDQLNEIYISPIVSPKLQRVTSINDQIKSWRIAKSEIISWKSKDGATIEGVLHKPDDYDPNKKYPLLVVIHGGPTGIDYPTPVPAYVYPIVQWLNKGALVLRPNYRGSAGYGEAFRSLNVENLGVGDAWDVISGVEYLDSKGLINKNRMGCMGWSQGGYISAFLTTTTDIFKGISVGAGISDWATYYVNTDIHPFTRQYLKATPWSDPEIYKKTSPISYINQAKTPTLIQHGEFDKRVPIPNAYELLQGLRDHGVESELIVYKGFGHGITKPKERLAANWHNWKWFGKYIWNEEIELPITETIDKK
ncbi:MAG TPA: S9 family peptidase [Cyclobacteriaceae bacterium]